MPIRLSRAATAKKVSVFLFRLERIDFGQAPLRHICAATKLSGQPSASAPPGTATVAHWLGTHGPYSVCLQLSYHRHRYPSIVIRQAIWLYFRFSLSYRDIEDMLAERGIDVSYETVRRRALKFGAIIARKLRRARPRPDARWHLDEVFISINGRQLYVWRAVDSEGEVLDNADTDLLCATGPTLPYSAASRTVSPRDSLPGALQRCCSSRAFPVIRKTVTIGRGCRPEIGQ